MDETALGRYAVAMPKAVAPKPVKRPSRAARILQENLTALLDFAGQHEEFHDRALAELIEEYVRRQKWGETISKSTIYDALKGARETRINNIALLARAFNLEPWHLLVPDLDPANPPVIIRTIEERELWAALRVAQRARAADEKQQRNEGRAARRDPDRAPAANGDSVDRRKRRRSGVKAT